MSKFTFDAFTMHFFGASSPFKEYICTKKNIINVILTLYNAPCQSLKNTPIGNDGD